MSYSDVGYWHQRADENHDAVFFISFLLSALDTHLSLTSRAIFYIQTRWAKTHPLRQIAHPLQAFRPNGLIDYFSLFYGR